MSQPILFQDLPATFPAKNRYWRFAALGSVLANTLIIVAAIVIPMMFTAELPDLRVLTYVLPPPPGPAPINVVALPSAPAAPARMIPRVQRHETTMIAPVAVPDEIARVAEMAVPSVEPGLGVPGGVPWGSFAERFANVVSALPLKTPPILSAAEAPPAPPKLESVEQREESPIRLSEFYPLKTIRVTPPAYPRVAKLARIQGTVLLDVTLSEAGKIAEIRVISGDRILAQAAVECVQNWVYEPPMMDGKAVRVIIPVRLNFRLEL